MLPRLGASRLISIWIKVTVAASLIAHFDGGWLARWTALAPALIARGQLWRLVTWAVVTPEPLGLILTCVAIYRFGGELVERWGAPRVRSFMLQIVAGAATATVALGLVVDRVWHLFAVGGWAVSDALVIAWARQFPDRPLRLYGVLELSGRQLIAVTITVTCVYAIFDGVWPWTPELLVCAAAYAYPSARLSRPGWRRWN
ncbi:MAG TPA: rhomboid family intramembrane serine protease [Kofleriaceae bacterium]|nr:rhomboid family intramembrane serine protease [Kofleriaceae bacterium]